MEITFNKVWDKFFEVLPWLPYVVGVVALLLLLILLFIIVSSVGATDRSTEKQGAIEASSEKKKGVKTG